MVYDCFSFFNELDLLEIRLNVLNEVVDRFVVVEATKTHSNKDKPLYYWENRDRYKQFHEKIIYIKVDNYPLFTTSWTYENHQRNMILEGLKQCNPDDVVMISDLDEIPNPESVRNYKKDGIKTFEQKSFSCFLNYKSIIMTKWYGSNILCYRDLMSNNVESHKYSYTNTFLKELNQHTTPTKIRFIRDFPVIKKGGWHFTYLGGVEKIKYKIEAFAHQELNDTNHTCDEIIKKKLEKGIDLFNPKDNRCIPIPVKKPLPEYIVKNSKKYSQLIYPVTCLTILRSFLVFIHIKIYFYCWRLPYKTLRKIKKAVSCKK